MYNRRRGGRENEACGHRGGGERGIEAASFSLYGTAGGDSGLEWMSAYDVRIGKGCRHSI